MSILATRSVMPWNIRMLKFLVSIDRLTNAVKV
jgi:hypothetical protein